MARRPLTEWEQAWKATRAIIPGQNGGYRPGAGRKKAGRKKGGRPITHYLVDCALADIPPWIPPHTHYNSPIARFVYCRDGRVFAQGIFFHGVPKEKILVLVRRNAGQKWIWVSKVVKKGCRRRCIWKKSKH
jgi:hypothetical protein